MREAVPNLPEVANCKAAPQPTALVVEPRHECGTAMKGYAVVNDHEQRLTGHVGNEDVAQGITKV